MKMKRKLTKKQKYHLKINLCSYKKKQSAFYSQNLMSFENFIHSKIASNQANCERKIDRVITISESALLLYILTSKKEHWVSNNNLALK